MRNLTITRRKTFVGCAIKMKVYIEDPQAGELSIQDTPCRKLGELKSGETATFAIEETAAKVFVIGDAASKNYCFDFYALPEGQEDIALTGKNHFNLTTGNAFLFDNNDNPEAQQMRKKGSKTGLVILVAACIVGLFVGQLAGGFIVRQIFAPKVAPKTFSSQGMTITLTNQFEEATFEGYTVSYDSSVAAVFAIEEEFSLAEGFGDYTLEEYGQLVLVANDQTHLEFQTSDGLTWYTYNYNDIESNESYHFYCYIYKAEDAFWLIQFATPSENATEYQSKIHDWAKSVSFD